MNKQESQNQVSIIINGVRYDSEIRGSVPNKCEKCDLFEYCFIVGSGMKNICDVISNQNISFKKSDKKFEV